MKQIKDFPNYAVTEDGKIFSLNYNHTGTCRELKQHLHKKGYLYICVSKNGLSRNLRVHRLIAETFIPNPDNKPQVNHIDGDKSNNHVSNLEWVTPSENLKHAHRTGLLQNQVGVLNNSNKLSENQVKEIRVLLGSGLSQTKIAELFSVSRTLISSINTGRSWSHL